MAGEIDTTNKFGVGVRGNNVVVLKWGRVLTFDEAMNLAAYIVATAEAVAGREADMFSGETDFDTWLNAVRAL